MRKSYRLLEGMSDRLRKAWKESGLTQTQIAERVGADRKTIHSILNGYYASSIITFAKICKVLNCSTDYILFGKE